MDIFVFWLRHLLQSTCYSVSGGGGGESVNITKAMIIKGVLKYSLLKNFSPLGRGMHTKSATRETAWRGTVTHSSQISATDGAEWKGSCCLSQS